MNIPFSPPDITEAEINEVIDTLRSGWITTGPKTKRFEREISEYCKTKKTVCLNSATAALELTLRVLGVGEGDEVITTAYTYTATASVILHVGAKPVLVDTAPNSFEMDYDKLKVAITEKTRAIIYVDLAGIICDYEKVYAAVEEKKNLFVPKSDLQEKIGRIAIISDAAHAFGASKNGKMCGNFADFTCFSFHAVKNLTTAEGGAVTFNDINGVDLDALYKEYQLLSLHGQNKDAFSKAQLGSWEYDIVAPNYKCNMTDIAASMGLAQLKRYEDMICRRHDIIKRYNQMLDEVGAEALVHEGDNFRSSGHLYIMRLKGFDEKRRNAFIIKMAEKGVATNVHYKPLPMHTAYKNQGFDIKNFPEAFKMYQNEVTLPLHNLLTDEQVEFVIKSVKESIKEV